MIRSKSEAIAETPEEIQPSLKGARPLLEGFVEKGEAAEFNVWPFFRRSWLLTGFLLLIATGEHVLTRTWHLIVEAKLMARPP